MYECHLTYERRPDWIYEADDIRDYAEKKGWKMSTIDGDPGLGAGERIYLTCHDDDLERLWSKMRDAVSAAGNFPTAWMPAPVREKIEHIIHDPLHGLVLDFE